MPLSKPEDVEESPEAVEAVDGVEEGESEDDEVRTELRELRESVDSLRERIEEMTPKEAAQAVNERLDPEDLSESESESEAEAEGGLVALAVCPECGEDLTPNGWDGRMTVSEAEEWIEQHVGAECSECGAKIEVEE